MNKNTNQYEWYEEEMKKEIPPLRVRIKDYLEKNRYTIYGLPTKKMARITDIIVLLIFIALIVINVYILFKL